MTGRELSERLNYIGMEKGIRKLAIKDHPDMIEKIATMSELEVCDLIAKDYDMLYSESEEIGLVKKDDYMECLRLINIISR